MLEPSITTCSSSRKASPLDHLLKSVMGLADDDLMVKAVEGIGFRSIEDLTTLKETDIDNLKVKVDDAYQDIPVHIRNMFKILRAWKIPFLMRERANRVKDFFAR